VQHLFIKVNRNRYCSLCRIINNWPTWKHFTVPRLYRWQDFEHFWFKNDREL